MLAFVTVGSTSFDKLIKTVCVDECLNILTKNGFTKIVFQIGKGTFIPSEKGPIQISWYLFKENISDDIKKASLVISHGGAGTILETLKENKPIIVVLNEELMNNHQEELARRLAAEDFLKYTTCLSFENTLQKFITSNFDRTPYETQGDRFIGVLECMLALK